MKTLQNILFLFAVTLFLQSCVASSPSNSRKSLSSSVKTTTTTPVSPVFAADELLYWFSSAKVTGTITVNKNSDSIIYLRGSNVHTFLASTDSSSFEYYRKTYCVVGTFGGTNKQLRVRAVPIYVTNYSTNTIERLLRIDIPSSAENASTCGYSTIDGVAPGSAAYTLKDVCTSCLSGSLTTTSVAPSTEPGLRLFVSNSTAATLTQIPKTQITFSSVALKIDLTSSSSDTTNSCTNSSCSSKGFDCCISGQCVKDASEKSNASLDPQYSQAKSDYATNPLSFINYPNIYNICTNISHTPPVTIPPTTTTPVSDAQTRVNTYLADYTCIYKVVTTNPSQYSLCLPAANEAQYLATKKKLAIACGCPSGYDDTTRAIRCPDWGVRPLYKSSVETITNIVDFYCYTPTPANPIGTITNLNVTVPSRSAPHRFYSTGGKNYDDLTGVAASVIQEGDDFYYLDDANKASPVNGSYNVNSVIGRINVGLSQAQPAKMVGIELGKTYILSTTSGYFTPCSKCAKDSWFQTFTAHPATSGGNGLRASGFTTARDSYSSNATLGNYEDTKFGRACYLPVTMLPWSHKKEATAQLQRMDRLKTQAAYYINGYQRDWFGFNKGALIGSFDGVQWFAIGSGRRITATSTKLYLAYNSSFLDLADRTDTIVNIIPDLSASTAPDFDYDPELGIADKSQNMAGSCQQYHQCETDTDCVTQLGWEYSCADMSQLKTHWPVYDTDSKEIANQEKTGTLFEILGATATVGGTGKRCVYRGAGAPCLRTFTDLDGNFNQKALTCAPNFYCASLNTSKFNDALVRSPNEFDDILFGMDANVLGRPLNYVTANKPLTADIITNIKYNGASDSMGLSASQVDDMGICRPGKAINGTAAYNHSNPDTAKRSDYISQVGSCGSAITGAGTSLTARTVSCPAIGVDLNYADHAAANIKILSAMQNSCGGEAKDTGTFASAFANIEGGSLALLRNITQPVLAADACFRRAGSACFTDLDCGPNRLHSDTVGSLNLSYFGGTQAEQSYWQENLVCGQGDATPAIGSAAYNTYQLNQNRCCREIGKDFTMYTTGPATIVPENMGTNVNLDTKKFATYEPKAANRYSRYTVSDTAISSPASIPAVTATAAPSKNQWKVINETGSLTCCGGGWVRKFADGTHDWTVKSRLSLETSNFQCLNYRSPLVSPDYNGFGDAADKIVKSTFQREYEYFCKSPSQNGCMQILYRDINGYTIVPPLFYEPSDVKNLPSDESSVPLWATAPPYAAAGAFTASPALGNTRLDTGPVGDITTGNYTFKMNQDVPYQPFAYTFTQWPYDLYTYPDGSKSALTWFSSIDTDYGVSIYLPAYIPFNTATSTPGFSKIYVKYFYADGRIEVVNITNLQVSAATCNNVANYPANVANGQPIDALGAGINEAWCVSANSKTQNRPMLNVKAYTGAVASRKWAYASVVIDFQPLEKQKGTRVSTPGNAYYYLTKLGRLELIGIPQITYEPIYCNNNQDNLVPGIFSSTIKTRAQFDAVAKTNLVYNQLMNYDEDGTSEPESTPNMGNIGNKFTYQDQLSHAAVFSSKDFTCCTPLGKETASGAKCCSGYANTTSGKLTCKLPIGTDLNVFFNKFVSGEGIGDTQPGGGLLLPSSDGTTVTEEQSDFNEYTGEPKMRPSTFQKLEELGKAYCANLKVGNGGSFGQFPPEPYSGYVLPSGTTNFSYPISIVDSIIDSEASGNNAGKFPFDNGYRWDHHYYCK
ncbi:MAG: hypothetical protein H7177_04670 [Rhizobacter sp.]|nr:hypothetical protein [Bacteriovorax sp.]